MDKNNPKIRILSIEEKAKGIVRKRGDKWVVLSKDGKTVLGTHDTKKAALRQLRAIEANKSKSQYISLYLYEKGIC